jgi:hypothetical protein
MRPRGEALGAQAAPLVAVLEARGPAVEGGDVTDHEASFVVAVSFTVGYSCALLTVWFVSRWWRK